MWQERLRETRDLSWLEKSNKLKYGLSAIPASSITNLEYCEQQTKLQLQLPTSGEDDPILQRGKLSEELISPKVETTIEEIITGISTGDLYICKMALFAEYQNVIIAGTPDELAFYKGKPLFVVEMKKSSNVDRGYSTEINQLLIYRWLLEEMGFDCKYVIPILVKTKSTLKVEKRVGATLRKLYATTANLSETHSEFQSEVETLIKRIRVNEAWDGSFNLFWLYFNYQEILELLDERLPFFTQQDYEIVFHNDLRKCGSCIFNPRSYRFTGEAICKFLKNQQY